jgi:hypothetical protein
MDNRPVDKSVGAALVLTFFFGPIGMFYASIVGALVMIVLALAVGLLTFGFGLLVIWPATMIWAAVAAGHKHQEYEEWKITQLGAR